MALKDIDSLLALVHEDMERVEQMLMSCIDTPVDMLNDICRHILGSGGKRIRPLILLLTARFCGYQGTSHIPLACVLEYIHTATLLHDDVIDHAEIRRGSSSAHRLWGNQATILAGDYFFARAFSLAVAVGNVRILEVIARAAQCLAEAETFQVAKTGDPLTTEQEYFYIIENKTASLIEAAARSSAILGGLDHTRELLLADYGRNLGIAFQIMDDVLDYQASEKDLGKTIGKDLQEGCMTLPLIAAFARGSEEEKAMVAGLMNSRQWQPQDIAAVRDFIEKHQGTAYAVGCARQRINAGLAALASFDTTGPKAALAELAGYVMERSS
jgi:octaprenyl-diphosphate synthase